MSELKLSAGTQEVLMRDAANIPCRCGRALNWEWLNHTDISATAECECGMCYTAMLAVIKIEGIDRNSL